MSAGPGKSQHASDSSLGSKAPGFFLGPDDEGETGTPALRSVSTSFLSLEAVAVETVFRLTPNTTFDDLAAAAIFSSQV